MKFLPLAEMARKRKFAFLLALAIFSITICSFWQRDLVFCCLGQWLLCEMKPTKSDVIVVLRGDRNYDRVLDAARLLKNGYADYIYISTELFDKSSRKLREYGVELWSEQDRLKSILIQLAIPEGKILVEHREPGGGTKGEAKRIRAMMHEWNFEKAIVITNWWHTKRTYKICQKIFDGRDARVLVVAAKNDRTNPSNWWKYRYTAKHVLEEFPKIILFYLDSLFSFSFLDDPKLELESYSYLFEAQVTTKANSRLYGCGYGKANCPDSWNFEMLGPL